MRYRKKPVEVEAFEISEHNVHELAEWCDGEVTSVISKDGPALGVMIPTLEGHMLAAPGWWIIKGVQGEFYPCRGDIFTETYEAVE